MLARVLLILLCPPFWLSAQPENYNWDAVSKAFEDSIELVVPMMDSLLTHSNYLDSTDIIKAIRFQGRANRKMGNYVQSIEDHKIVYQYAKSHGDSLLQARAADQIGIMNTFMGNMKVGQKYLLEVAELYKKVGSKSDIAGANNGLAIFYNDMDQIEEAIKMYNLSLSQYEAIDDTMGRANIHANLGMLYVSERKFDLAEYHILMQGKLDTMMQTQWGLGFHHDYMGVLRRKQGRNTEALQWYKSALEIRNKLASHYNRAESVAGLSATYLALERFDEAIQWANEILKHKEDHQSLSQQIAAYSYLSKAYEGKGDFKKSLSNHKEYKLMSDSIYQRDMLSEIADKDALYQRARKDEEIARLDAAHSIAETKIKTKNRLIRIYVLALIVISLLLFALYRLLKKVSGQKDLLSKLVAEKDMLLREIHHRVKNNLQLVSSLLTLQGRSIDDATALRAINDGKARVRSMALIHQDLYSKDSLSKINVRQYMQKLTRELFTTYRIDEDRINLSMDIQDIELDIDTLIPIGLILNELITNSLKYAWPEAKKGTLKVEFYEKENHINLSISDDGVGYEVSEVSDESFGFTLVTALTEQLEGTLVRKVKEGTKVNVSFPN